MLALLLFCSLAGAVLGTRYRVFCLVPATAVGLIVIVAAAGILGAPAGTVLVACITLAFALQAGYAAALAARWFLAGPRAQAMTPLSSRPAASGPLTER